MNKERTSTIQRGGVITGSCIILFAAIVFLELQQLKPQARMLPVVVVYCMIALGALIIVRALIPGQMKAGEKAEPFTVNRDYVITFASMVVTYLLVPVFGFYTAIALFVVCTYLFYIKSIELREILHAVLFSIVLMGCMYLLFSVLMHVRTPGGVFF